MRYRSITRSRSMVAAAVEVRALYDYLRFTYVRVMRIAIVLAALLTASTPAIAGAIAVTSPRHPQTFAYGEMIWHQLYPAYANGELVARITFSNLPYAGDDEPRRDEAFDFRFPGVRFDRAQRTFFANG